MNEDAESKFETELQKNDGINICLKQIYKNWLQKILKISNRYENISFLGILIYSNRPSPIVFITDIIKRFLISI